MQSESQNISYEPIPWVYFKMAGVTYAISSEAISTIVTAPTKIESLPQVHQAMLGVFVMRGEVVPLLSVRKLIGLRPLHEEAAELVETLQGHMQEYTSWTETFENCVKNNQPFLLEENPRECEFGKWYYSFKADRPIARFHLSQVEEPHEGLHLLAIEYNKALQNNEEFDYDAIITKASQEYEPIINKKMNDTINLYKEDLRGMVIVLDFCERLLGIMVDSVLTIKNIEKNDTNAKGLVSDELLYYTMDVVQDKTLGSVIKLNYEKLLECLGG